MHATESKREACSLPPWSKHDGRRCEHGDSRMLREIKTSARKSRRAADKREITQ